MHDLPHLRVLRYGAGLHGNKELKHWTDNDTATTTGKGQE
jgi:hypothetical protein